MKKIYVLFILIITLDLSAQTVTTFLNSPDADIDDALALDSQGNLFGSTYFGGVVYKVTPDGSVSPFVTGLVNANGLAIDSEDNLFVAEYGNGTINKYDTQGNILQIFSIPSLYPSGLIKAYKKETIIFTNADFTDPGNNSINELLEDGSVRTIYEGAPLDIPVGLTYGPGGELFVANYQGRQIYRLSTDGDLEYVATVPAPANFVPFLAFITYAQGFIYGTVYGENKIYKINPRGVDDVEIYAGSTFGSQNGDISEATFAFPAGIFANKSGNNLYVSEFSGLGNIRKITNGVDPKVEPLNSTVQISTYPNPNTNYLRIKLLENNESIDERPVNVRLYHAVSGKLVLELNHIYLRDGMKIPTYDLDRGIYKLNVNSKEWSKSKTVIIK